MKIVVLVKEVPDTYGDRKLSLETGLADRGASETVLDEIRSAGGVAVASVDSVTTAAGGAAIVQRAVNAFGRIDVVVCNAGIGAAALFVDMTDEQFQSVLDTHLSGTFNVARPAF